MIIFIIKLLIAVFIIRFHVNAYRLGYNPVVDKLNQLTDPVVLPFKRLMPSKRYDYAALVPAVIIAVLAAFVLFRNISIALLFGINILFITTWLQVIFYTMLIVVIGSWLQTDPRQPVMQVALSCSDWLLAPIRRIIPSLGGLDFSPIIALFAIQFAQSGMYKLTFAIIGPALVGHP